MTTGGSLLQLAAYIRSHGGRVAGAIGVATVNDGSKSRSPTVRPRTTSKAQGGRGGREISSVQIQGVGNYVGKE